MHDNFDCDEVHLELRNVVEDSGPIVSSILMPSWPFASKNIAMPNDLDEEIEITWKVLKGQLILNKKPWVFTYRLFFPYHFFVVNDGSNIVHEEQNMENKQRKWEGLGSKYPLSLNNAFECCPSRFEGLP